MPVSRSFSLWSLLAVSSLLALALALKAASTPTEEPTFCGENPTPSTQGLSIGGSSQGKILGAKELKSNEAIRTLPRRHARRCLNWGTPRGLSPPCNAQQRPSVSPLPARRHSGWGLCPGRVAAPSTIEEARKLNEPAWLLERAESVLHQPTDSRPHDDHFHLRIRCTPEERSAGCVG